MCKTLKGKRPHRDEAFNILLYATLVVVRVFELRHSLQLLLSAAHHGMVGSPVIRVGAARGRGLRRRGSIRWRRGSPGRRFARRGRGR